MAVNAKRKGTRNEHRSIRLLEASGYAVTRAAVSLGVWDLVGIGSANVVLCQVKTRGFSPSIEGESCESSLVKSGRTVSP